MSCRAFVLSVVFLTAAVAQAPEPTRIDFSRSYTRSYSLIGGKTVEVAVGLPAPSKLPANGRIAVEWAGYRKVLHALDADFYMVYRPVKTGPVELKVSVVEDEDPIFNL